MPVMSSDTPVIPIGSIQDFLIGQDDEGRWVALETHGLGGGIFISRDAAMHYALGETSKRPGAVSVSDCAIKLR